MEKIKRNIMIIFIMSLVFSLTSTCFASEALNESDDELEEIYLNNYEDYEDVANSVMSDSFTQDELKQLYDEYQVYMEDYYKKYKREETVKAKVILTEPTEERYEYNDYYYSVAKYEIQPIVVEIIEGEYIGKQYEIDYLLTGDSLNNTKYSEVSVGDTIFVGVVEDEETGETYVDIMNTGANIERFGTIFCIGIIALLLVVVYGGKKGILTSLIAALILDFCLVIIPNMGFAGQGFLFGGISFIILMIITLSLSEMGFNKKAAIAMMISTLLTVLTFFLCLAVNHMTRIEGITFEASAVSENVLMGNMNFVHLYLVITMAIATFAITNMVCKTMKRLDERNIEGFNEQLDCCKDLLGGNVLMLVITMVATYIPNQILLLTNKYTNTEILNSEILGCELTRIFAIIIAMSLAIPTVVAFRENKKSK